MWILEFSVYKIRRRSTNEAPLNNASFFIDTTGVTNYKHYPPFNPPLLNRKSRAKYEECLSYALNHRLRPPNLRKLQKYGYKDKDKLLAKTSSIINSYYNDPELTLVIYNDNLGEIPPAREGYYVIALAVSFAEEDVNKSYMTTFDYHFLVQNNDGFFSHRQGGKQAQRVDSDNKPIVNPAKAKFCYEKYKNNFLDYKFIGYLYVKINENRIATMQEKPDHKLFVQDVSIAKWKLNGNFSFDGYRSRKLILFNKAIQGNIDFISFKAEKNSILAIEIEFKSLDICNYFIDTYLDKTINEETLWFDEENIYFNPKSQKEFDYFFRCIQRIDPIDEKTYELLFRKLNITVIEPSDSWVIEYPIFNENSIGEYAMARFHDTSSNCASYALQTDGSSPSLTTFELYEASTNQEKLTYTASQINCFFSDPDYAKIAPFQSGSLPEEKDGYYVIALALLEHCSEQDFHFMRQDQDKTFSHRRGQGYKAEKVDSDGNLILIPEFAKIKVTIKDNIDLEYKFVGYLYIKCKTMRLSNLSIETQRKWQALEKNKHLSSRHLELFKEFMKHFFQLPLPEFFQDTRDLVLKFYSQMIKINFSNYQKNHFLLTPSLQKPLLELKPMPPEHRFL